MIRSLVEIFKSTGGLRGGTFLRFTKSPLSKNVLDRRGGRGRRGYQLFLSKFFVSHCQKLSQGNPSVNH